MARIVIDPGHGGWQSFPQDSSWNNAVGSNGTLEKNLTLNVGKKIHDILKNNGHNVELTRKTDVNVRFRDRTRVARNLNADAFVSIHFNGSTGHNAQGTETLVHINYSHRSARLSLSVQDKTLIATGLSDRNKSFDQQTRIKPQRLAVLNPSSHLTNTAACLVEISFLDRADEEQRLQNAAYLDRIAQAVADGIVDFVNPAVAVPAIASEVPETGDAIEAAALEATGHLDTPHFLQLDISEVAGTSADPTNSNDTNEIVSKPRAVFSKAFVEGSRTDLVLLNAVAASSQRDDLVQFLNGLNLTHFAADEFLFMGTSNNSGKCNNKNHLPSQDLWDNIKNTATMLDKIREKLGAPIRILSCYRSPEYNSCIKGESGSLHMKFSAIDFTCAAGTPEIWRRVADTIRSSHQRFRGGIGVYPTRGFVHIDTRGSNANWQG